MKNRIRFWHYGDVCPVLITIKAGQTLHHSYGGATDEGWSRTSYTWEFDGQFVRRECVSDGVDCDGRLTRFFEDECHIGNLTAGNSDPDEAGIAYPDWQALESSQRDYSAEAMGY